jgi:hypothetical protein
MSHHLIIVLGAAHDCWILILQQGIRISFLYGSCIIFVGNVFVLMLMIIENSMHVYAVLKQSVGVH